MQLRKPSPALVVSSVALFVSLAGTGLAQQVSGQPVVKKASAAVAAGQDKTVSVNCPAAMHATGGGYLTNNVGANDSYPVPQAGTPRGWRLTTHKAKVGATGASATVYVICAS